MSSTAAQRPPATTGGPSRAPHPAGFAAARCIARLQRGYRQDNPAAVAALARLRRGAGRTAHEDPDQWGHDGLEELAEILSPSGYGDTPEGQQPEVTTPPDYSWVRQERAEEAVHLAVTLWALHQQSVRDSDMHVRDWDLGRAVRVLARGKAGGGVPAEGQAAGGGGRGGERSPARADEALSESLRKRFVRIGTSTSLDALAVRLREMVLLLREARVPLDYARLADQLYAWQDEYRRADVRRTWGREFHLAFRNGARSAAGDGESGGGPGSSPDLYDGYGPGE